MDWHIKMNQLLNYQDMNEWNSTHNKMRVLIQIKKLFKVIKVFIIRDHFLILLYLHIFTSFFFKATRA